MDHSKERFILALLVGLAATAAVLFLLSTPSAQAADLKVNSTADVNDVNPGDGICETDTGNGVCTLRAAIAEANTLAGPDVITFDTDVFLPSSPATITITSDPLPYIDGGNITINGSGAGVVISGSAKLSSTNDGFRITSNNNTIISLTIQNFPSDGVDIRDGANRIEDCVIRGNGKRGVRVAGSKATGNKITQNSITDNDGSGIITTDGGNGELAPPIINSVVTSTNAITVTGFALLGVTVELFRDPGGEGATFLGDTTTDSYGNFTFTGTLTTPLGDDNVTATATDPSDNTSMFNCYPIPIPNLVWPISGTTTFGGPFSSPFGPRLMASEGYRYDWHRGLDIPVPTDTPAYAVADGKVRCAGKCSGYSDPVIVQIEHEDGCYYCNYLHMLTNTVKTGDTVNQGEEVGTTGTSASGFEHLHFEIRRGGYYQRNAINPFVYLPYTDTFGHTAIISGVYVHTASMPPTVTARVVVTAPANELDFNRLALTVTDGTKEVDWRAADFHVFNIQKSTIEHPEVLDNPYVDDICIMPARFNTTTQEYRIDFVFYGLEGSDSITLTAEAADVHSNVVYTTVSQPAGGITISPGYATYYAWPGNVIAYTHTLANSSGTSHTLNLSAKSAQSWTALVSPSSVYLNNGDQEEITAYITVPTHIRSGTTDCTVVTAADITGTIQVIAVDVTSVPYLFLPVIMKGYP